MVITAQAPDTAPPPARRRPAWAVVLVLGLAGIAVALQQTLLVPLLPEFPAILSVSSDDASWVITAALLASAIATPIMTRLADMFGKRRMMLVCLASMTVGSVLGGLGVGFYAVVAARSLQGLAAAMIPIAISIMRDELPKERVSGAVALMSATFGIGAAAGLPLSGIIYEQLGWHAIFWISAGTGLILIAAILWTVSESTIRTRGRFDYPGAILLSLALGALLLAISKGSAWGWGSQQVILLFTIAAVAIAIWVPVELKTGQPLVDLRTSGRRPVLLTNVASLLVGFAMFANLLVTVQQLQLPAVLGYGFGMSVVAAGLAMVPGGVAMVLFSPISGRMITKYGGRITLLIGIGTMAAFYILRIFTTENVVMVIVTSTVISVATAVAFAAMPTLIMAAVPITETASANGLNALVRSIGTSICSATIAAVLASLTVQLGPAVVPSHEAVQVVFALTSCAALAGFAFAWYIPTRRRPGVPEAPGRPAALGPEVTAAGESREFVVGGSIRGIGPAGEPVSIYPAVITVMTIEGAPVDWNRVDNDGNFKVVIPSPGRYLALANAAGWIPQAGVVEIVDAVSREDIVLRGQLCVSGQARRGGSPIAGALISLNPASGGVVTSIRTDESGRYSIPLPVAGRYIVTMLEPDTQTAHARKVALDVNSVVVDFDLPKVKVPAAPAAPPPPDSLPSLFG